MTGRRSRTKRPRGRNTSRRKISEIRWTPRARRDVVAIGEYIARHNPSAAAHWIGKLDRAVEDAARFPLAGRHPPEVGLDDVREVIRKNYRIVYRVTADAIQVLTVFEGHRLLPADAIPDDD